MRIITTHFRMISDMDKFIELRVTVKMDGARNKTGAIDPKE